MQETELLYTVHTYSLLSICKGFSAKKTLCFLRRNSKAAEEMPKVIKIDGLQRTRQSLQCLLYSFQKSQKYLSNKWK